MNKRMAGAYRAYLNSDIDELYKAYGRCSQAKWDAWEKCKSIMREKHGQRLRIIGHSTWKFSAGFVYEEDSKQMFAWITDADIKSGIHTAER